MMGKYSQQIHAEEPSDLFAISFVASDNFGTYV